MTKTNQLEIAICMGSSCFARGNQKNLVLIEEFLADNQLTERVELCGLRCLGDCIHGPNIRIGEVVHHAVDAGTLMDLLEETFDLSKDK